MENPRSLLLNWTYFPQEKTMDDLKQSFLLTMELEDTKLKAQEELKARDQQISQLKDLLARAIKERDEAQDNCQKLLLDKLLSNSNSALSSIDDDHLIKAPDSSDCDESTVSSPHNHHAPPPEFPLPLLPNAALPEKGKFLEAVIKAGPLLQTLLLAGPLPQWRHPPPPLDTNQIPPFPPATMQSPAVYGDSFPEEINGGGGCGKVNRKRAGGLSDGPDSSKCQRILLH